MAVVYIDQVFALNAAADLWLLVLTAKLSGTPVRWGRVLAAACIGGLYAAAAYLPGWGFLWDAPVKCAAGVGLALAAFGAEERLFRLTALFFAVSCGFAGFVLALGLLSGRSAAYPDAGLLLWAGTWVWAVSSLLMRAADWRGERRQVPVRVCVGGRTADLTALWDSGNGLREDGQSVLVVSPAALGGLLPIPVTSAALRNPADLLKPLLDAAPVLRPRLLPYRAVGVSSGLLVTIESEWTDIGGSRYPRLRIALSPTELGGCDALWGGAWDRKGGAYGHTGTITAVPGGAAGAVLHRGQRHPAPAPEPGEGGGTAGTYDGGTRPAGVNRAQSAPRGIHCPPV